MATEEEKKVEQTQPQMPKQLEYANQVINSMTDNKGYNPIQTIINTAPKTHEEAKFRKAQIDRGGYTPTPMQMSGLTEEQVKANEEAQRQAKADADAKAQAEKEANEEKWSKRWAAIGDGISSIANLVAVGHGAPNMYDPSNSLHSKIKGEYDRIHALKAADAQARRKEQMDLLLADLGYKHQASENEKNRQSRWAEYIDKAEETKRHNQEMEDIARNRAESYETNAQANKTRADKYKGGGSGGTRGGKNSQGKWEIIGPDGNTEYYDTKAEWEARAKEIAPEVGVSLTTRSGRKQVKKDSTQVAAEVNAKNRPKGDTTSTQKATTKKKLDYSF